jgi:hypothetical protein
MIGVFIIWGLHPSPLKRNLVPRFMNGEGANDERHIDHGERRISKELNGGNFLVSHAAFPSMHWRHGTL